jgi:hypothetical protein
MKIQGIVPILVSTKVGMYPLMLRRPRVHKGRYLACPGAKLLAAGKYTLNYVS